MAPVLGGDDSLVLENSKEWMVIETPKDFCVVEDDAVLCVERVNVGDRVQFDWSRTLRLEGVVRYISDDSDSCHAEARRLHRLSRKTKSESFHVDRPRKCRRLADQRVRNTPPVSKSTPKLQKPDRVLEEALLGGSDYQSGSRSRRGRNHIDSDDSDTDVESSHSDSNLDVTQKVLEDDSVSSKNVSSNNELLSKILMRFDVDSLRKLANGEALDTGSGSSTNHSSDQRSSKFSSFSASVSSDKPLAHSSPVTATSRANKRIVAFHRVSGTVERFDGPQYLFPEAPQDPNKAVELYETSGVFCCILQYSRAEAASTATLVARRLLEGVFTKEALMSSSVTGLPPRGKGKAAYAQGTVKPFLDPKGINAIVCQSLFWQKKKHFVKKKDETQIRQSMAVRLNEVQRKGYC